MPGSSAEFPGPVIHKNLVPDNDENDAVPSSRRKVKRAISKKRTPSVKDSSTLKPAELEPLNDNVDGAKPSL